ncbi:Pemt [Columba livia]|nr:Pemt [Columba livia]
MVTPALPWAACSNAQQPFGEEIVPQIQPQPPLVQLEAVSSAPGACSWGAEPDPPGSKLLSGSSEIRSPLSTSTLGGFAFCSGVSNTEQETISTAFPSPENQRNCVPPHQNRAGVGGAGSLPPLQRWHLGFSPPFARRAPGSPTPSARWGEAPTAGGPIPRAPGRGGRTGARRRRGPVASPGRVEVQAPAARAALPTAAAGHTLAARDGGGRACGEVSASPVPRPGQARLPPRRAGAQPAAEAGLRFPAAPPRGPALGRPRAGEVAAGRPRPRAMAGRPGPGAGRRAAAAGGGRPFPRECCEGLGGLEYGQVDVTAMARLFSYVDVTDSGFIAAVLAIAFNPLFWNVVARWEHKTRALSRVFGSPHAACYCLGAVILMLNCVRSHCFTEAMKSQPKLEGLDCHWAYYSGLAILAVGTLFVISSFLALGFTGTFLGDYFGILMEAKVTSFPFSILDNPMYWGSTAVYLGWALMHASPAGLLLTAVVAISYTVAMLYEGPFTEEIYLQKQKGVKNK